MKKSVLISSLLALCAAHATVSAQEAPATETPPIAAAAITAGEVKFDEILPGAVWFGTVYGDRNTGPHGTFVKIKRGAATPVHTHSSAYRAVVLAGAVQNPIPGDQAHPKTLTRGSYYDVPAGAEHITRCEKTSPTDCMTFFYQTAAFDFTPVTTAP